MSLIRLVRQAQPEADLKTVYDAIVVGSGAAGGMAAHVLTSRGMKVLLPAGLGDFAADVNVQRIVSARFEDKIEARLGNLQRIAAVAVFEEQPIKRGAGRDGFTLVRA